MRNPDLPKLLRAIGKANSMFGDDGTRVIYDQSAIELEKLEKIYALTERPRQLSIIDLLEILNAN